MEPGDILGHEFMGEVVETGPDVPPDKLKAGDRVIVPFPIACGNCFYCKRGLTSCCDNSNPKAYLAEKLYGFSTAGIFGYSHLMGGYAGGQAEYARVPFADFGAFKVPQDLPDEKVILLTDIFPTGYMAAENCNIHAGDVVAVWGCGPVGQFAIRSAYLLGAAQVIAIDDRSRVPERLDLAEQGRAITIDIDSEDVYDRLLELTGGIGPDACIDAVGMEAHGQTLDAIYDKVKSALMMETERPHALRQAIDCCRKGGNVSIPGVYGGVSDKIPMGAIMNKGLTIRTGQTHVHRYLPDLLGRIQRNEIDPSFVITHTLPLSEAPHAYRMFRDKTDGCIKVVLKPRM
jgi:threonine dehydrogenase-like Zn-dependent dehydrogenase